MKNKFFGKYLLVTIIIVLTGILCLTNPVTAYDFERDESSSVQNQVKTPYPNRQTIVNNTPSVNPLNVVPEQPLILAQAMGIKSIDIVNASINGSDPQGIGVGTSPLGSYFPTEGDSFAILSTGLIANADDPNDSTYLSSVLEGLNNSQGNDLVQLALQLKVPLNMNCASLDFAYYSEEYPEFVGSIFNDTFTVELGGTNLSIADNKVVAPLNFAFDTNGNIISVNTSFTITSNSNSTYDGLTPLLRAQTPVNPGSIIDIVFSVQDLGDSVLDSAVMLDKFFWSNDNSCGGSVQEDKDQDGLLDIWETNGLTVNVNGEDVFVDLPKMGADPNKKDVFVEIDYMEQKGICLPVIGCVFGHNHFPKSDGIAKVVEAYKISPVTNPDGSTGINLHVDYGNESIMNPKTGEKWGSLSKSDALAHDDNLGTKLSNDNYSWNEFDSYKNSSFSKARAPVFHYCIFAHNLGGFGKTSGISRDLGASDFLVTLGSWSGSVGTVNEQAGTFMHELGHNMGLRHGGDDHVNYEPNYLSVMNYSFQTAGLHKNNQDGHFDYSRFALPDLSENNLDETVGLGGVALSHYGTRYYCPGGENKVAETIDQIDWNCNGDLTNSSLQVDINNDSNLSVLGSYNDWLNLVYTGGAIGQPGADPDLPMESKVIDITFDENALISSPFKVSVEGPGNILGMPGTKETYVFIIRNMGTSDDQYSLFITSTLNWAEIPVLPDNLLISAGGSVQILIDVSIPISAKYPDLEKLMVSAQSQSSPMIVDSAYTQTGITPRIFLPYIGR